MIVSCYKPGAKDNEVIVRLFETGGRAEETKLFFYREIEEAVLVDLLERDVGQLPIDGNSISLTTDPFGIVTMRIGYGEKTNNV